MEKKELRERLVAFALENGRAYHAQGDMEERIDLSNKELLRFIEEELDEARMEGMQIAIAGLSISENMEKVERFFRECPIDYDDKCNMWFEFLDKLLKE